MSRKFDKPGRLAWVLVRSGAAMWCYAEGIIDGLRANGPALEPMSEEHAQYFTPGAELSSDAVPAIG